MCQSIFKKYPVDIHGGGIDLRFPHHDNEMAQTQAHAQRSDLWIRYFLHTGHLHINKEKMSRSKKNFTTVRDVLREHSWRQLRMLFLLHRWDTLMNFEAETSFPEAVAKERQLYHFFHAAKAALRELDAASTPQAWDARDFSLSDGVKDFLLEKHLVGFEQ